MNEGDPVTVNKYTDKEQEGEVIEQNGSLVYVELENGTEDWFGVEEIY